METKSPAKNPLFVQTQELDHPRQTLAVYHLSHDLRGPLNSVLGFADLLLEGVEGPLNDIQLEDIAAIRQSAQNLLELINNVVDLSKIGAGKLKLNLSRVSLERLAQRVAEHDLGEGHRVTWESSGQTLPTLHGDFDRIEEILLNLAHFLFENKAAVVQLEIEPDDTEIEFRLTAPDVVVDEQKMAELPELSVITDDSGRSKLSTGGLRVPLAYQLAEQHGGQISIDSQDGVGSTFYLRLPVSL